MDFKDRLKRLIADAVSVWRDPEARRPFTRREVSEEALLRGYRRSQAAEDVAPDGAGASRHESHGRK